MENAHTPYCFLLTSYFGYYHISVIAVNLTNFFCFAAVPIYIGTKTGFHLSATYFVFP